MALRLSEGAEEVISRFGVLFSKVASMFKGSEEFDSGKVGVLFSKVSGRFKGLVDEF